MLKGTQVILDVINPDHIEWMRVQRNQPSMRQYFREWKEISKDQQAKWYASRGNNTDPNHVYFEIRLNPEWHKMDQSLYTMPDNSVIGCCGLHYVDWRLRAAEFGIFLCDEVHGKGMGKEALTMLFDYGFREMNLHKIWAEVYSNNQALHVYTKGLGMKQDGLLRDNYFKNGKYGNSIMLSVLEDEWFEAHGGR
jgi:RimJ/RimL family protein N-acetyltransferase